MYVNTFGCFPSFPERPEKLRLYNYHVSFSINSASTDIGFSSEMKQRRKIGTNVYLFKYW